MQTHTHTPEIKTEPKKNDWITYNYGINVAPESFRMISKNSSPQKTRINFENKERCKKKDGSLVDHIESIEACRV